MKPPKRNEPGWIGPDLPEIVEVPLDETMAELMLLTGDDYSWDNPAVWEAECRCVYPDGSRDQHIQVRRIIAFDRDRAKRVLQVLMSAFKPAKVLMYHLRGPMTPEQIARVKDLNEELARMKKQPHEDTSALPASPREKS